MRINHYVYLILKKTASDHPPTAESSRPCDEDDEEYNHYGGFFCNIKTKIIFVCSDVLSITYFESIFI